MPISFKIPAAVFKMILPSEQRFWVSALSTAICFLSAASAGLRYNYGDGSFYVGQVDEKGRPDGVGKYFNTTGALGKDSTGYRQSVLGLYSSSVCAMSCHQMHLCNEKTIKS